MILDEVVRALKFEVKSGGDRLRQEVSGGYVGDLLSDVMANSREGDLWITRQIHQNIVAVASLKDLSGIVLVSGAEPAPDTVEKASAEGIPLLLSRQGAFEIAGRVYQLIGTQRNPTTG